MCPYYDNPLENPLDNPLENPPETFSLEEVAEELLLCFYHTNFIY